MLEQNSHINLHKKVARQGLRWQVITMCFKNTCTFEINYRKILLLHRSSMSPKLTTKALLEAKQRKTEIKAAVCLRTLLINEILIYTMLYIKWNSNAFDYKCLKVLLPWSIIWIYKNMITLQQVVHSPKLEAFHLCLCISIR